METKEKEKKKKKKIAMTLNFFAENVVGVDPGQFCRVLQGTRHFRIDKAIIVANILKTDPLLWINNPNASKLDRQAAFKAYQDRIQKRTEKT